MPDRPEPAEVFVTVLDQGVLLTVVGSWDQSSADLLETAAQVALADSASVVLDLTRAGPATTSSLSAIGRLASAARDAERVLQVRHPIPGTGKSMDSVDGQAADLVS